MEGKGVTRNPRQQKEKKRKGTAEHRQEKDQYPEKSKEKTRKEKEKRKRRKKKKKKERRKKKRREKQTTPQVAGEKRTRKHTNNRAGRATDHPHRRPTTGDHEMRPAQRKKRANQRKKNGERQPQTPKRPAQTQGEEEKWKERKKKSPNNKKKSHTQKYTSTQSSQQKREQHTLESEKPRGRQRIRASGDRRDRETRAQEKESRKQEREEEKRKHDSKTERHQKNKEKKRKKKKKAGELLRRNEEATFVLTTRESFEFMNVHFQGHQAVRIRPLDEDSSEHLVHQLLPGATTPDCIRITQICGHVPLAMKLLCSSISEDNVQPNQFLDELRLSAGEKEALVCLSILPENFDQEVAAAVMNLTRISATKKLQSLRRKSLLDSSSKPGSFQIHTLLQSFAREKGEHEMRETVLNSKARFYAFYISLFEKLNKQFLTGHSMSALNQFYENEQSIVQSLTEGCMFSSTANTLLGTLVNAELFLDSLSLTEEANLYLIYDSAIEVADNLETNVFYRQLLVSIAFFEVILGAEGRTMQLLNKAKELQASSSSSVAFGEKGKTLCYSGINQLVTGKTEEGVQILREALSLMENIPEQAVLRLVVCQILAIYYRHKNNPSSFNQFYSKGLQECRAAGGTQLLVIPPMDGTVKETNHEKTPQRSAENLHNHPLELTILLLVSKAANNFSDYETKQCISNAVLKILKDSENSIPHSSLGLSNFQRNIVYTFYFMNKIEDASKLSEARINYHQTALKQCNSDKGEFQRVSKHFPANRNLHEESLAKIYWDLGLCQYTKANFSEAIQSLQRALKIRLKLFGDKHSSTADSYYSLGVAQDAACDLVSALQSLPMCFGHQTKTAWRRTLKHG
ncbi:hypothetical protein ACROYT_G032023 [Oculina patagonica]